MLGSAYISFNTYSSNYWVTYVTSTPLREIWSHKTFCFHFANRDNRFLKIIIEKEEKNNNKKIVNTYLDIQFGDNG